MRAPTTVRLLRLAQFPILRQLELEQACSLVAAWCAPFRCSAECHKSDKHIRLVVLLAGAAAREQRQLAPGE